MDEERAVARVRELLVVSQEVLQAVGGIYKIKLEAWVADTK